MPGFDKFSPRRFPVIFAFLISGAVILALESPGNEEWNSPGGHRDLHHAAVTCESCHQPAPGTLRDKIQSNFQYWLGRREQGAAFFKKQVHSSDCLDCHRNIDQHAGFLFQE
ncbi:MAG: hypothetical protein NZ777_08370, partial [Pseudomonadales bacterium]|nr:hypothetical protein [Pseudomonadales bacterium]